MRKIYKKKRKKFIYNDGPQRAKEKNNQQQLGPKNWTREAWGWRNNKHPRSDRDTYRKAGMG